METRLLLPLRLLYIHDKDDTNLQKMPRETRWNKKVVFKNVSKCKITYLSSPFYKGEFLWHFLPENVQKYVTVNQYVSKIREGYKLIFYELLFI